MADVLEGGVIDTYSGFHQRRFPDYNGWTMIQIYHRGHKWYWTAWGEDEPKGFEYGPFDSSKDAYYDADV